MGIALEHADALVGSFLISLGLFVVALIAALPVAAAIAAGRLWGPAWLRAALLGLVIVVRGVPGVLVLIVVFFALPFVGPTFSAFESVVLTLAAIQTVYVSEVFRAAMASVDRGQVRAATALGMRPWTVFRDIVAPQAAVVAAPAFLSSLIQLGQNTTIASAIGLYDLLGRARIIAVNELDATPILLVAPLYVLVLLPLVRAGRRLERRLALTRAGAAPGRP